MLRPRQIFSSMLKLFLRTFKCDHKCLFKNLYCFKSHQLKIEANFQTYPGVCFLCGKKESSIEPHVRQINMLRTVFELFKKEMITVHNLKRQKKQQLRIKIISMKNFEKNGKQLCCQMWSQICIRNFVPTSFFNEWLEKHGIMRNQFQEPKLHRQPEEFYSQWFL